MRLFTTSKSKSERPLDPYGVYLKTFAGVASGCKISKDELRISRELSFDIAVALAVGDAVRDHELKSRAVFNRELQTLLGEG